MNVDPLTGKPRPDYALAVEQAYDAHMVMSDEIDGDVLVKQGYPCLCHYSPPLGSLPASREDFEDCPIHHPNSNPLRDALARHIMQSGWVRSQDGSMPRAAYSEAHGILRVIREFSK